MLSSTASRVRVAAFVLAFTALPAFATTYTVNSTADTIAVDGVITLREAITAAVTNAPAGDAPAGTPGLDTINFNIPGGGVQTIALTTPLPLITDPILIDGLSQPGAAPGALLIQIQGGSSVFTLEAGSSGSTVRGLVINSYPGTAIFIQDSSSNVITSNFIGTDPTGNVALPGGEGIVVAGAVTPASNNLIGGNTSALGNLVISNDTAISVGGAGALVNNTVIAGNRLGTNAAGTSALGALQVGVELSGSTNTLVGGTTGTTPGGACSGACNLIDAVAGMIVAGNGNALTVAGNFFGTDVGGTASLVGSSGQAAIFFNTPTPWTGSATIGGTTPAARNLISGFGGNWGIYVEGQKPPSSITIAGNFIGVDTTGTVALPNVFGVRILSSSGLVIGGPTAASGNVISGNQFGIDLTNSSGVVIQSNVIGPAADGATAISGTNQSSVLVDETSGTSTGNVIGAQTSGGAGGNTIADCPVAVDIVAGTNNRILSNSIFATVVPIALGPQPQAPNDPCDTDSGPNNLQNSPVLTNAAVSGGGVTLTGDLNSTPNTTFTIEVFSNPPGSSAQATTLIQSTTVTTNGGCDAPLNITLPALPAGTIITATATDPSGNTSPVSNPVGVSTLADLSISNLASAPIPFGGENITYTIQIVNQGPGTANSVTVTDVLPAGTTLVSASPAVDCSGTTTVTCTLPSLASGYAMTFTLVVQARLTGGTISDTATVSSATGDPNPANNSATATVTLRASPAVPALSEALLLLLVAVLAACGAAYTMK